MSSGAGRSPAVPAGTAGIAGLTALLLVLSGALVAGCSSSLDKTVRSMHHKAMLKLRAHFGVGERSK